MSRRFVTDNSRLPLATTLRAMLVRGYSADDFRADASAGVILGVVALPLSMALAIAAGAPPEYGLFTAIVAGIVIAVSGGSMHSVSGPTAAFVVLLAPVTARYGIQGLLLASLMAGLMLIGMGVMRLGGLIQFVPHPVTTGFTAGIGVVIAVLQLGDFVGVGRLEGDRIWEKLADLAAKAPEANWPDIVIGVVTLAVLVWSPKLIRRVPGPLIALIAATVLGVVLNVYGHEVMTINTQFGGIPAVPPLPRLPWSTDGFSWALIGELAPTAGAIAMLAAIESLLCAVVADGMAGGRHDPDAELIGLGIGNTIAPFFGGFAATGAIARTATGIRAGGRTPVAVVIHAVFLLVAMLVLAPILGLIPMAGMAGLLLVVAWNMSDASHFVHIMRIAPRSDVAVLLVCFGLTVVFDMVVAVTVGVILAALLFMRRMVEISGAQLVGDPHGHVVDGLPAGVVFYDIAGPLFFGAAEKALEALAVVGGGVTTVIIDLEDVPAVDATGLVALQSAVDRMHGLSIKVVITGVHSQPLRALKKAGFDSDPSKLEISLDTRSTLERFTGSPP